MLHWSGGVTNPFATFYLLHIALSAMMLPWRFTVSLTILTIFAYGSLLAGLNFFGFSNSPTIVIPSTLQVPGMLLAIGLTGASLAWFIDGLRQDLLQREVALHLSQERLAKEERFAGLATLAAGVAHELATPLGTIAIICRELEHNLAAQPHPAEWTEDAQLIRQEVDRCRKIIDRLNADATNDLGVKKDIFTLDELAHSLLEEVSPKVRSRIQYSINPAIASRSLEAPLAALLQALGTLLKNAAEADPTAAPVKLNVQLWKEATLEGVAFIIRDQGEGINPDILKRLGEPFLTTKAPGQGMGLGLYIVRLFAERLRGKLEFENTPHGGCEARLILPFPVTA
jgi:two-component system sensor histidine kinase RegB